MELAIAKTLFTLKIKRGEKSFDRPTYRTSWILLPGIFQHGKSQMSAAEQQRIVSICISFETNIRSDTWLVRLGNKRMQSNLRTILLLNNVQPMIKSVLASINTIEVRSEPFVAT